MHTLLPPPPSEFDYLKSPAPHVHTCHASKPHTGQIRRTSWPGINGRQKERGHHFGCTSQSRTWASARCVSTPIQVQTSQERKKDVERSTFAIGVDRAIVTDADRSITIRVTDATRKQAKVRSRVDGSLEQLGQPVASQPSALAQGATNHSHRERRYNAHGPSTTS
jgi:hypothetical protein